MYEGNYFLCGDFKESEWNSFVFVFFSLLESIVPPSDRKKLIVEWNSFFFLFYSIARKMRATKENEKKSLMLNSGWGILREIWVKGKWKDFDNVIDYCRRKIFSQKSSLNSMDPIRTWLTKPPKKIHPETSWKYLKTIFIDWLWEGQ